MKTKALILALTVACLGTGTPAFAHSYHDRGDARYDRDYRGHDSGHQRHYRRHVRGAGPDHDLRPGDRLPVAYWDGRHHVRNWQRARLPAPMPGCNWVRVGHDFVQSSVHTGKITAILLRG